MTTEDLPHLTHKDSHMTDHNRWQELQLSVEELLSSSSDQASIRETLAITIAEYLLSEHDALILQAGPETGVKGGQFFGIKGYARINGAQRSFFVSVYSDPVSDDLCERLLDKVTERREVDTKIERVRQLVDEANMLVAPSVRDQTEFVARRRQGATGSVTLWHIIADGTDRTAEPKALCGTSLAPKAGTVTTERIISREDKDLCNNCLQAVS